MLHAGEAAINFEELLKDYRKRNETTLPYTIQQVEDVMFVNSKVVISLEYIFYQVDGKYHRVKKQKIQDQDNMMNYKSHPLGTYKYMDKLKDSPQSIYLNEPIDLIEQKNKNGLEIDYLEEHSQKFIQEKALNKGTSGDQNMSLSARLQQKMKAQVIDHSTVQFMKTKCGNAQVEAVLSLWDINEKGQIMKKQEISFDYDKDFQPSTGTQMRLQLSEDKKKVSLPMIDNNKKVIFMAWNTKNLKSLKIPKTLTENTQNIPEGGVLKKMNFVGKNDYIQQVIKLKEQVSVEIKGETKLIDKAYYLYLIFHAETGQKLLEWTNRYQNFQTNKNLRVLGFLVNENIDIQDNNEMRARGEESEYGDEDMSDSSEEEKSEYQDEDEDEEEDYYGSETHDQDQNNSDEDKDQQYSGGEQEISGQYSGGEEEIDVNKVDLDLVFFYVNEMKDNSCDWVWSKKSLKLKDLIQAQMNDGTIYDFIEKKGRELFSESNNGRNFFNIPKSWFVKTIDKKDKSKKPKLKSENWESDIEFAANKKFKHFSILNNNKKKYTFMVFDNTKDSNEPMAIMHLPNHSMNFIVRNQMCKDYMMLIQQISGKGSIAHVFYAKDQKKSINFPEKQIYINALQDVQHQPLPEVDFQKPWDSLMLQTLTISKGDQEIYLKTEIVNSSKQDDAQQFIIADRQTKSQKHSAVYPMFLYNIGLNKLVLQNTLPGGKQYIIQLGINETFLDHINYRKLSDIGFYPNDLNMEASSRFAFLTFDKKQKTIINNFLICDPYYDDIQIALFKSTKTFSSKIFFGKKNKDVILKSVMYQNQDSDLKIVTQHPDAMSINTLKDDYHGEQSEKDDDDEDEEDSEHNENKHNEDQQEDEKQEEEIDLVYGKAPIIQDEKGVVYYITKSQGQCNIIEINPKNDEIHETIFEIKSEFCKGFCYHQGHFFFMDDYKVVNQLERIKDQRKLQERKQFYIKDKDVANYSQKDLHEPMFATEKYFLQQSKIFYLQDDYQQAEGILDMEQLSKQKPLELKIGQTQTKKLEYASGPYIYQGSSEFVNVYHVQDLENKSKDYQYRQIVYSLPDNKTTVLINDIDNQVNMSTFREDGKILLKVAQRFLLFKKDGQFIDEIQFQDLREESEREEKEEEKKRKAKQQLDKYDKLDIQFRKAKTKQNKHQVDLLENQWKNTQDQVLNKIHRKENKEIYKKKNSSDRMKLHRMSQDNKYFLFEDTYLKQFKLYQLKSSTEMIKDGDHLFTKKPTLHYLNHDGTEEYEFVVEQEIDFTKTKMFEFLGLSQDKPEDIEIFMQKMNSMEVRKDITLHGDVQIMCVVPIEQNEQKEVKEFETSENDHEQFQSYRQDDGNKVKVVGFFQQADGNIKNMQQNLEFDINAKADVVEQLDKVLNQQQILLEIKEQELDLLPKGLRDDSKVQKIKNRIEDLEDRMNNVYHASVFDEDLLLVRCGTHIKVCFVDETMFNDNANSPNQFHDVKINFDKHFEIKKILNTCTPYHLQIIAKNRERDILVVVVWDFLNDIEVSMFQLQIDGDQKPENYICKGMNQKRNYFVDPNQIFDLEYNIPFQSANNNSMNGKGIGSQYIDQRKIYKDGTRSLSIDHPSLINSPTSRMDLVFWNNIVQLGSDAKMIKHNVSISSFNIVYDDHSLFHYFADNVEVMEMIHEKYYQAKIEGRLKYSEINTPLTLLHPDLEGQTALDVAIEKNRPKSFEIMINMLSGYSEYMLSKLMLSVVPKMIDEVNDTILNFYNSAIYKPPLMQEAMIIPWPDDLNEFVFCSKTSIISHTQLIQELFNQGQLKQDDIDNIEKKSPNSKLNENTKKIEEAKEKKKKRKENRNKLMPQILGHIDEEEGNVNSNLMRVECQAIDFDWIFEGDNMETMIKLLDHQDDPSLYVQSTIKVFIDLIWVRYSEAIRKRIFYPYMAYLAAFTTLATSVDDGYLVSLEKGHTTGGDVGLFLFKLVLCIALWAYQIRREYKQIRTDFKDYITQGWNIIDLTSLSLNLWVFVQMVINIVFGKNLFSLGQLRAYIGVGAFIMWIKVFYWMRLYSSAAYYVKLITQTLSDVKLFLLLCLIIVFAFASLFFMLNVGMDEHNRALIHYTGFPLLDAVIAIYMFALGDFHYSGFINSEYDYLLWFSFLVLTFLMIVVFMNMIIAIMGNTFGNVMAAQEESALSENISLIYDHIWLLNLKEEFKGVKYIIHVKPDLALINDKKETPELLNELEYKIMKKLTGNQNSVFQRIESFEKNVRLNLKNQQSKTLNLKKTSIDIVSEVSSIKEMLQKLIEDQKVNRVTETQEDHSERKVTSNNGD